MKNITSGEFYIKLGETEDGLAYLRLINSKEGSSEQGDRKLWRYEKHHIQPKGLGGSNQKNNLIRLSVYEHCLAHLYLAKAIPCPETYYVLNKLTGRQFRCCSEVEQITLEEVYHWSVIRNNLREYLKGTKCAIYNAEGDRKIIPIADLKEWETKGYQRGIPESVRNQIRERQRGRKLSKEWIEHIQRGRKGFRHSEETKQKIGKKLKGRTFSQETLEKMSQAKKGKASNRKGTHQSEETKQKLREINLGKPNLKNRGKIYISKGGKVIKIEPRELIQYQQEGWIYGRKG